MAERKSVQDIWIEWTLTEIEESLQGSTDDEERRQRIKQLSDSLRSTPGGVEQAIRMAVERAAQQEMISEDEAKKLLGRE